MAKTLGYHITWTTYGTWLQGDNRRYVKDGKILPANEALLQANQKLQVQDTVKLSKPQQEIARDAITRQAELLKQQIYALAVKSNHIHIVAEYIPQPIAKIVAYYKSAARLALKTVGCDGKVWTAGYDKRFCFDKETLERRIRYVQNHNK
ncbi:MAG: transposase [Phycisphaerae bacterium]|jgi:REP element-mobilizing transposase RayT